MDADEATWFQLSCLQEKPTPEKLDMLYRKAQHLTALSLARTQNLDASSVADIHRQFGDHLYGKGDYDGAMQQYLKTVEHIQPSYVIRKVYLFEFPSTILLLFYVHAVYVIRSDPGH